MGRNMFGPVRGGASGDEQWTGWWGDDPPYHNPVFILTHHPRNPVEMEGGTTFHFVTDGIESALEQAREAAGGKDVMLSGGAQVAQQYLAVGLLDEPGAMITLGRGDRRDPARRATPPLVHAARAEAHRSPRFTRTGERRCAC
jgi:dihydrofolate reductase